MTTQHTINHMGALLGKALADDGIEVAAFARQVGWPARRLQQVINGETSGKAAELDYWAYTLGRSWTVALESTEGRGKG